jgi:hypothetical protein
VDQPLFPPAVQAASAVDSRTERLVLDLAALTFLDCAGAAALAMAAGFAPAVCPVIIRSLNPGAAGSSICLAWTFVTGSRTRTAPT